MNAHGVSLSTKILLIVILQTALVVVVGAAGVYSYYHLRETGERLESFAAWRDNASALAAVVREWRLLLAERAGRVANADSAPALAQAAETGASQVAPRIAALRAPLLSRGDFSELERLVAEAVVAVQLVADAPERAEELYSGTAAGEERIQSLLRELSGQQGVFRQSYVAARDEEAHTLRQVMLALSVVAVLMGVVLARLGSGAARRREEREVVAE